jgi:hypothetical protein
MKLKVTITKSQECYSEVSLIVDMPDDLQGKPKEIQEWLDDNAVDLTFNIAPDEWDNRDSEEAIAIFDWEEAAI